MVTLWWGKEDKSFGVPTSSVKNQMPISTQEILASSLQLYLLVAGRSSALFCAFYILCGQWGSCSALNSEGAARRPNMAMPIT
jgi:hypothetical protein